MRSFFERVAVALCSGYIIVYYGELVFWATPDREGMNAVGIIATWLVYSIMAYPFLCVVSLFKVRSVWAVFLAGSFYGWFEEGIIVQAMYGSPDTPFPMSISFTGLAWHALIGVWVGWYLVRRVLAQNKYPTTIVLACGIGLFYGLWGIFWWNEPPQAMKVLLDTGRKDMLFIHFALYAFATTALLVLTHWLYDRVRVTEFKPSKIELWTFGVLTLLYYVFVTVPAAPKAIWVLPPLMGVTCWALFKNRRAETRPDAIVAFTQKMKLLNYLLLLFIPLVASAIYFLALANDLRLHANIIFFLIATPLGFILWLISVVKCVLRRSIQ